MGQLIAENTGGVYTDYVYVDALPQAVFNPTATPVANQIAYVLTDRLGTPQAIYNSSSAAVWGATYKPFGQGTVSTSTVTNNLRLPGQLYDFETGFHYNMARDYMPNLGRYLETDPIGLSAGLNTYAYADLNPYVNTDPTGLWPLPFGMGGPGIPNQAQATSQISQALQNQGIPASQAQQIAQDITNAVGMTDINTAQAMQQAIQNGQQMTPSQQEAAKQFIDKLPPGDQAPLNNIFKNIAIRN